MKRPREMTFLEFLLTAREYRMPYNGPAPIDDQADELADVGSKPPARFEFPWALHWDLFVFIALPLCLSCIVIVGTAKLIHVIIGL